MAEALRYAFYENTNKIELTPLPGLGLRLIEMWIDNPPDLSYFDIIIGPKVVARVPVRWGDNLYVSPYLGSIGNLSIFSWIRQVFGPDVYPEADQSEKITLQFSTAMPAVHLLYQYTAERIDKTKLLRSEQTQNLAFMIITHSVALNATKSWPLDRPLQPVGYSWLADGQYLPPGMQFVARVIAFGSAQQGNTVPTYLHLWRREFELYTPESHQGIRVRPTQNFLAFDITRNDYFDAGGIVFTSADKFTANVDISYDGNNAIPAGRLALIMIGILSAVR